MSIGIVTLSNKLSNTMMLVLGGIPYTAFFHQTVSKELISNIFHRGLLCYEGSQTSGLRI